MSIERIRAALAAGPTPGPWSLETDSGFNYRDINYGVGAPAPYYWVVPTLDIPKADAAFIAACYPEAIRELLAERDALKVENEKLLALERDVLSTLPGVYYMDPPDGGSVPLGEQVRRMAVDAARYRWLRDTGAVSTVRAVGDAGDPTYPDAERCAQTLENCEDDLLTEAAFVRWQGREIDRLREWQRQMVEKAASGGRLDGYRELAGKLAAKDAENDRLRAALVAAMEVVKAERERITQYDFVEPKRAEELDAIIAQARKAMGSE